MGMAERNAVIYTMNALGIKDSVIAKEVGVSRSRVGQILQAQKDDQLDKEETPFCDLVHHELGNRIYNAIRRANFRHNDEMVKAFFLLPDHLISRIPHIGKGSLIKIDIFRGKYYDIFKDVDEEAQKSAYDTATEYIAKRSNKRR